MATRVALGIDLGTSGVKVALVDLTGRVHGTAQRPYPVASPRPGWAETDPALWAQAARSAVAQLLAGSPGAEAAAVGIAGQMHGTVLVNDAGTPVRPAILWPDSRATDQIPRWKGLPNERRAALANPLTPGMPGPVLGWLAEHEPDTLDRAAHFVLPKDWLRSQLVASPGVTDPSDASASLLWDLPGDGWATDVAESMGVPLRLLPSPRPASEPSGALGSAVGSTWGLPTGVPVSVGCGDVAGTLLGLDAVPKRTILTVGTGAQLVLPDVVPDTSRPITHHTYRDASDGWFALGAIMNAGLALSRVVELLGSDWESLYQPHDRDASLPGFVPYFVGERLPAGIPPGGASWFDIGLETTRSDLLAAALEGVAFTIRRSLEAMPSSDTVVDLVGGGTRAPVFNQLLADVLHRPLRRLEQRNATVLGAGRLGWLTAGEIPAPTSGTGSGTGESLVEPRRSTSLDERYARFLHHTSLREGSSR